MTRKEPLVLPNFICIGAQKTGTTTLYHILKNHPEITVSHPRKETKYFYRDEEYKLGLDYYSKFFSYETPKKAIGEFDPDYLFFDYIPQRIFKELGENMKFIVMLRHPIDRAYSQYLMSVKKGFEKLSFEDAIQQEHTRLKSGTREEINNFSYISRGYYDEQLARYFKFFPKKNFLFINYEKEFNTNLNLTLRKICVFLKIADVQLKTDIKENGATEVKFEKVRNLIYSKNILKQFASSIISNKELKKSIKKKIIKWNSGSEIIKPLDAKIRKELFQKYFSNSIANLETMIDTDLSDWRKN